MVSNLFLLDESKKKVRAQERFHGFDKTRLIKYGEQFKTFKEECDADLVLKQYGQVFCQPTSISVVRESYQLWDALGINIHDIPFLDLGFSFMDESIDITEDMLTDVKLVDPYELPIVISDAQNGYIGGLVSFQMFDSLSIVNKTLFLGMFLPAFGNDFTSCAYLHEVSHSQIINANAHGKDMLNREVIPILIEQIVAGKLDDRLDLLRRVRYFRINCMASNLSSLLTLEIPYESRVQVDTFIKSTIEAIKLANIYFSSKVDGQKEMLSYINSLFAGKRNVDDMLQFYDIDYQDFDLASLRKIRHRG